MDDTRQMRNIYIFNCEKVSEQSYSEFAQCLYRLFMLYEEEGTLFVLTPILWRFIMVWWHYQDVCNGGSVKVDTVEHNKSKRNDCI